MRKRYMTASVHIPYPSPLRPLQPNRHTGGAMGSRQRAGTYSGVYNDLLSDTNAGGSRNSRASARSSGLFGYSSNQPDGRKSAGPMLGGGKTPGSVGTTNKSKRSQHSASPSPYAAHLDTGPSHEVEPTTPSRASVASSSQTSPRQEYSSMSMPEPDELHKATTRVGELQAQLQASKAENDGLKAQVLDYQEQIKFMQSSNDATSSTSEIFQMMFRQELIGSISRKDELDARVQELTEELEYVRAGADEMQAQHQRSVDESSQAMMMLTRERDSALEKVTEHEAAVAKYKSLAVTVQLALDNLTVDFNEKRDELLAVQQKVEEQEVAAAAADVRAQEQEQLIGKMRQECEGLRQQMQELTQQHAQQLAQLTAQHEAQVQQLNAKQAQLQQEAQRTEEQYQQLKHQMRAEEQQRLSELHHLSSQLQAQAASFPGQYAEITTAIKELNAQVQGQRQQVAVQVSGAAERQQSDSAALHLELAKQFQQTVNMLQEDRDKLNLQLAELKASQEQQAAGRAAEVEALRHTAQEVYALREQVAESGHLKEWVAQVAELRDAREKAETEAGLLLHRCELLQAQLKESNTTRSKVEQELEAQQVVLKERCAALSQATTQLLELQQHERSLLAEHTQLKEAHAQLKTAHAQLVEQVEQRTQEVQRLTASLAAGAAEVADLMQQKQQLISALSSSASEGGAGPSTALPSDPAVAAALWSRREVQLEALRTSVTQMEDKLVEQVGQNRLLQEQVKVNVKLRERISDLEASGKTLMVAADEAEVQRQELEQQHQAAQQAAAEAKATAEEALRQVEQQAQRKARGAWKVVGRVGQMALTAGVGAVAAAMTSKGHWSYARLSRS